MGSRRKTEPEVGAIELAKIIKAVPREGKASRGSGDKAELNRNSWARILSPFPEKADPWEAQSGPR